MIRWLVDHSTTVILAVIVLFFAGLYSYISLPREASPDITIPVVTVTTPYTGVSPKDIESLITIPLENELAGLQDVKEMTSTSAEGASIIAIEFEPDVVIEDALQKVRDRVSQAESDVPEDADDSIVREIAFSDIPILIVTIAGDVDEEVLKKLGEDLEEQVARVPGVLEANLSGGLTREIKVHVDPVRLAHYGLSLRDVSDAIGNENVNIPGGTVDTQEGNVLFRVPGEFTHAREVEDVAIKRIGDRPVFVRDVATVFDGYEDRETYARMNGETAVSLSVTKRAGENIVEIADQVKELVATSSDTWPEAVGYRVLADQSSYIRDMVTELQNNIITALLLVVAVLVLFMGFRTSGFVALAIPLSMLLSFAALQMLGFTLNMIVLFSLILALGMLVDNAIVIVENIYRYAEEGHDKRAAAIGGTKEVAMAVAASTATTVAAFFPLVFWTGIMGEFMGFLPKTLIIVLLASLAVAIGVLPVFMARFMPRVTHEPYEPDDQTELAELDLGPLMRAYREVLEFSIGHRYIAAGLMTGLLVFTFAMYGLFNHGTEFFPETDPDRVTVRITAPTGTDVETTDRMVRRVEGILAGDPNVDTYVAEVGVTASGGALRGSEARANEAKITVDFLPDRNEAGPDEAVRVEPTPETMTRLREAVATIPGARIVVEPEEMGPPVGDPIAVEVSGDDYHEVGAYAQRFRRQLAEIAGTTDLRDDYKVGRPELALRIDRAAAKRVGVSTAEVGNTVRSAVAGTKASALRDGEEEYDIMVQLAPEFRGDVASVLDLRLPGRVDTSPDTFPVPLSSVASYELAGGTGAIRHIDQDLVVTISGDVLAGYNENDIRAQVQELIDQTDSGEFHLAMAGANEEQEQAVGFLIRALFIALALIMMVLVTQFDSIAMPAIIVASVVLSLIGVLWGLLITGTAFGVIMTGIGVISLAGVVVNNAIVLLDYVEQLKERGLSSHDALVRAGITRFRPVMLTAITTVLGLMPMALGVSLDFTRLRVLIGGSSAQFWGPMAIAVIFGLSFATLLTLVMVPTMYSIYEDLLKVWSRVWSSLSPRRTAEAAAKLLLAALLVGLALPARAVTLDEAVDAAEEHNLDLALARAQTVQTETLRGQAWALIQPRLSGQLSYNVNQYEVVFDPSDMAPEGFEDAIEGEPVVIQEKTAWAGSATLSQPIFSGSAIPALQGAYKLTSAAHHDEKARRHQILAGVARAYYGLAVARQNLEVAKRSLASRQDQLDLAERRVEAGVAARRNVLQAELAVSRAERGVAQAREQVVAAEESFTRVTGLPRDSEVELPDPPQPPADLDAALETGRAERPELLASRDRVSAARYDHTQNLMGWLPRLDANLTYNYSEAAGFAGENWQWFAGVTANWTLWDGGARLAQAREKAAALHIQELMVDKQVDQVEEDVRTAWERYQRAEAALKAVKSEVALAQENLDLAERGVEAGSTTWLEMQEAELGLRQAELAKISERMNRDMAIIDLLVAMGTPPV